MEDDVSLSGSDDGVAGNGYASAAQVATSIYTSAPAMLWTVHIPRMQLKPCMQRQGSAGTMQSSFAKVVINAVSEHAANVQTLRDKEEEADQIFSVLLHRRMAWRA